MDKRSDLRKHFTDEANQEQSIKMHAERSDQLNSIEETIANAFGSLLNFMEKKISKVELTNQLREISTPDVANVVAELKKLGETVNSAKTDQKPVIDALNALKREITLIPSKIPKEKEQKETIKVSNLSEVKLDTTNLEKVIEALDLKVDVKAPIINTEKTDTKQLEGLMAEVLKAIKKQEPIESVKVSNLKDIKPTDLSKVEKKLDLSNKHLKEIAEKKFGGGGGGGGNGSPYTDNSGIAKNVILTTDGRVPVDIDMAAEGIATATHQTDGSQKTQIVETLPNDSTKLNPSVTIPEVTVGTVTTKTIQKTIGTDVYQKTVAIDSSDNSISISAWSKL